MNNPAGYWLCVGDGDEVEARIGPTALQWYRHYDDTLQECQVRNNVAMRENWDSYYSVMTVGVDITLGGDIIR